MKNTLYKEAIRTLRVAIDAFEKELTANAVKDTQIDNAVETILELEEENKKIRAELLEVRDNAECFKQSTYRLENRVLELRDVLSAARSFIPQAPNEASSYINTRIDEALWK